MEKIIKKFTNIITPDNIIEYININYPEFKGLCIYDIENKSLISKDNKVSFYFDSFHNILEITKKMTILQALELLESQGLLRKLYRMACINYKAITYRDIYLRYDILLKINKTKTEAMIMCEDEFNTTEATIRRAIQLMTTEI